MSNPKLGRLLVVDDEVDLMSALRDFLNKQDYEAVGVSSPQEGIKLLQEQNFDLLLSDLMMPEMDGIQLLRKGLEIDPNLVGIMMTGHGTVETAVAAMKTGAFDYLQKPFKLQSMLPILARAMDVRRLRVENVRLRQYIGQLSYESPRYHIVGACPAMQRIVQLVEKVAPTDATVLVRGPSGTGKELIARALHHNSPRRDRALVTINCAALQESLLESELFGHERGAFTGAVQTKRGLIEVAELGTLFVDEVAEMTPALQAKLLRVLEDGHFRRVGGTLELHANVRVIAATNKPLEDDLKAGRFREDLFYRLNVVTIALPALRERRQDIPLLIEHFLTTRQLGQARSKVTAEALGLLMHYDWPGNIRELANVLERAQILAEDNLITVDDLPENLITMPAATTELVSADPLNLSTLERRTILAALEQTKGNKVQAAKALGVSRRALYRMIEKHGLDNKNRG